MDELKEKNLFFIVTVLLFYFILSLVGIINHEVWLDEAHSFLIARDSESLSDLIHNTRLEGHPIVWYYILWLLKEISSSVFAMQLVHIFIATTNVFLLLYYSPFNKFKKILLAFSYYFFYEYNIISRNYAICLLCTTIFCILICKEKRNYILISIVLAIMANTHFLGLLLSFSLMTVTFVLLLNDETRHSNRVIWVTTCLILLFAIVIGIFQVIPQEETMFAREVRPGFLSMKRWGSFSVLLKGLYQFPQLGEKFWNTNMFTENKTLGGLLTLVVLFYIVKIFATKPLSLLVIITAYLSNALFLFSMLMHNYTVRHWGFVFLGFYAAIWFAEGLNQSFYDAKIKNLIKRPVFQNQTNYAVLVYSVLLVQVFSSCYLYYKDINYPFSNSKNVAEYIVNKGYDKDLIVVSNFTSGPAVSAYLGKKLYYPEYHTMGSFGVWTTNPIFLTKDQLLSDLGLLKKRGYKRVVLALDKNIFEAQPFQSKNHVIKNSLMEIKYLAGFKNGIGGNENYELFLVLLK
jgi:hypothetical protein